MRPVHGETLEANFSSAASVPLTAAGYTASGKDVHFTLSFEPTPGTRLTVVQNTGLAFLAGQFSNLAQGQTVNLTYAGNSYAFVANYCGGNGHSLVLEWPGAAVSAWGSNAYEQLGNGGVNDHVEPVPVVTGGVLAGKTIIGIAAGQFHSVAVTADGRAFGWGDKYPSSQVNSQVGNRSTVPVAVDTSGVLAGKTLVAVTAGGTSCVALASDGTAYSWAGAATPVAIDTSGVLADKSLVAVAGGYVHNLGLTSEGRVVGWGSYTGVGNNSQANSSVPVATDVSGVLAGKTISAIAAGYYFSLAVSSDGRVYSWGFNTVGQLGNNSTTQSLVPVAVNTSGALAGKTITAVAAGMYHSLALSSDGKVFAWGENTGGELGSGTTTRSSVPVAVVDNGALAGKTVVAIAAGAYHSLALTADGMAYVWGSYGSPNSTVPVALPFTGNFAGRKVLAISGGYNHSLALLALGAPSVLRNPTNQLASAGASVTFTAAAGNEFPSTIQWQASPLGPSGPFSDIADNPTATTGTLELTSVTQAQHGSAYRAVFSNLSGSRATLPATLTLVDWTATLSAATGVAFQGEHIVASGPLNLQLGFAPSPGTNLTVVKNTGTDFIIGRFSNVPQGGTVPLTFNGVTYGYIANYFGGNGRSLVLQWPLTRMAAWGRNLYGELGNDSTTDSLLPFAVSAMGPLAGKTVVKVAAGSGVSMALTSEGRLFACGNGGYGQLGRGDTSNSRVPVEVSASGELAGKTVVAMAIGNSHCLALTDEGKVYAWGLGSNAQLGVGYYSYHILTPTAVDTSGELAGKRVVAISAGYWHSLALTSEGTVVAWGDSYSGELGNGFSYGTCLSPMAILTAEELAGRSLVSIAAGGYQSLAIASDGKLFAWGNNDEGELGNATTSFYSGAPTAVNMTGALAGKSVISISTGWHDLALTADGRAFGWGSNYGGQLGIGNTTDCRVPTAVNTDAALAGKTLASITAGYAHSLAITTDGQCFAWGNNDNGQLGTGTTTTSLVPVPVTTSGAFAGMKGIALAASTGHSLVLADAGPPIITLHPFNRTAATGATVSFIASASHPFGFAVRWQVSPTGVAGPFSDITGNATATTPTLTIYPITSANGNYAYRAVFSNISGDATTNPATLSLVEWTASLTDSSTIPFHLSGVVASGLLNVHLNYAPPAARDLTLIGNSGPEFISGNFDNIPQGGRVSLSYAGITYDFIANYYGGNGRSLVLQWPWTRLAAWGSNGSGQLGNGSITNSTTPVDVTSTGLLLNKTVTTVAAGYNRSLAVTSDGQLFTWGDGTSASVPVVVGGGDLAGKTVVAAAAGTYYGAALTADGRVFSWGNNFGGVLGNGNTTNSGLPVAVYTDGALAGKSVVAISAGGYHTLALASDGGIYAWGYKALGDGKNASSSVPVPVDRSGALAGKSVVAIEAGDSHSLALTSDGKVFAWGDNTWGQLGTGNTSDGVVPMPVVASGDLAGKFVVAIAAGNSHSLALTADGKLYAWGYNTYGQLGDGTTTNQSVPVAVATGGVLAGKSLSAIAASDSSSFAITSDGQVAAWGYNSSGQLGNGSTTNSLVPVTVTSSGALAGRTVKSLAAGSSHGLLLLGGNALPVVTLQPKNQTLVHQGNQNTNVRFLAAGTDVFPPTIQWQECATGSAGPFSDMVGNPSATTGTLVLENVTQASHGHAFRAVFSNHVASVTSVPATLSILSFSNPANFAAETDAPLTCDNPLLAGSLAVTLGFTPVPGTDLTLLKNTGASFIQGVFDNLPQGSILPLTFGGLTHLYVVDYFGGDGRSLVLHWAKTRLVTWGDNSSGQLGYNGSYSSRQPVAVDVTGPLAGKTVIKAVAGGSHSLALTSDGVICAWGSNYYGQLGKADISNSSVPIAVDATGVLAGKSVVGIAAGTSHSMALASDGSVFAWGGNSTGQLGNGTNSASSVPVAVTSSGALMGKTIVAIAAGGAHSLALTSEGRVFAWGLNNSGQLGTPGPSQSWVPIEVSATGVLAGKTVIAIAAGSSHSLALTSDGCVYSWGSNQTGQLGNSSYSSVATTPVAVVTSGVLSGKTVVAIAAGSGHSLALTSDGNVFTWGRGDSGQLGNNNLNNTYAPVAVLTSGVLAGKSVTRIAAGANHCEVIASDGRTYSWGDNQYSQLGDNSYNFYALSPVAVVTNLGALGTRRTTAVAGGGTHGMAIAGAGNLPVVVTQPANSITVVGVTATLTADASGLPVPTIRWQVSANGLAGPFSNISTSNASAITKSLILANATASQNGYAYRAVFTNTEGSATTSAAVLTVYQAPVLTLPANLTTSAITKDGASVSYDATATDSIDGPLVLQCDVPSGSNFPIGTTTVHCTATNSLGSTSSGSFTITVLRSFAAFQDRFALASGPTEDPYHTGLANLVTYAFDMDPTAPDFSRLPAVSITNGYLQISYQRWRDAPDLAYVVEVSDDLLVWSSAADHVQLLAVTPLDASRERVLQRDAIPVTPGRNRFIRVRLTQ